MHHPSTKQVGLFGKDFDLSSVTCPVLFSVGSPTVLTGSWCSVTPARWEEILQVELLLPVTSFTIIIYLSPCHWTLCSVTARLNKWCGLNRENSATGQFRYCVSLRDVGVRHPIALSFCIQSQPTLRDLLWQDSNSLLQRSLEIYAYHNNSGAVVPFCPVICKTARNAQVRWWCKLRYFRSVEKFC